jgi:hypothetical protein
MSDVVAACADVWDRRAMEAELDQASKEMVRLTAEVEKLKAALKWYAEQVEGCRKLGSIGDSFRHALDADGGKRARAELSGDKHE